MPHYGDDDDDRDMQPFPEYPGQVPFPGVLPGGPLAPGGVGGGGFGPPRGPMPPGYNPDFDRDLNPLGPRRPPGGGPPGPFNPRGGGSFGGPRFL